jgi:soluble lytic murein transglycosylase-like protein
MKRKALIALGGLVSLLAALPAEAKVRLVVRDGKKIIYNDGVGEPGASRMSDGWLVSRMDRPSAYDTLIEEACSRHQLDARLVKSVMLIESNFNPAAVSRKGARGLMQLMPDTARAYDVEDIHDPEQNVRGGVAYLSDLLAIFGGDLVKSLAAYNAGENAVIRYGGVPPYNETRRYVQKALTAYYGRDTLGGGVFRTDASAKSPARVTPAAPVRVWRDDRNRLVLTTDTAKPRGAKEQGNGGALRR